MNEKFNKYRQQAQDQIKNLVNVGSSLLNSPQSQALKTYLTRPQQSENKYTSLLRDSGNKFRSALEAGALYFKLDQLDEPAFYHGQNKLGNLLDFNVARQGRVVGEVLNLPSYFLGGALDEFQEQGNKVNPLTLPYYSIRGGIEGLREKKSLFDRVPQSLGLKKDSLPYLAVGLGAEIISPDPSDALRLANKAGDAKTILQKTLNETEAMTKFRRSMELDPRQAYGTLEEVEALRKSARSKLAYHFNRIFNPLQNTPDQVKHAVKSWGNELLEGGQEANIIAQKFKHIPEEDGWKMIQYLEKPTQKKASELGLNISLHEKDLTEIRRAYDELRQEALDKKLDVGYLQNYVNHVWNESWNDIVQRAKGLGTKPSFIKNRQIPTYEEGLKMDLKPLFTHPSQLIAHYKASIHKAVANKKLADELINNGALIRASKAPSNWEPITAPLFPTSVKKTMKGTVTEYYKASPEVADVLNNIFRQERGGLAHTASNISKMWQELTLSGGYGSINSFSLGHLIKEMTAGRVISPLKAFARSFDNTATQEFFLSKADTLKRMAREGVAPQSNIDYSNLFRNVTESKTLKSILGKTWSDHITAPTFQRFLPMLEVQMFDDIYRHTVKELGEEGATKLASETLKNFYGKSDNLGRAKFTDDVLGSIFFAPRFRESMINFWVNNSKALLNPKNPAYRMNQRFLAGTVVSFALYNALNYALTGHSTFENKKGKEAYLEIPINEERSWFIPILPTIGTIPRWSAEIGSNLAQGNIREATQKVGGFFSQPINLGAQLTTNRNFFGSPIYDQDDSTLEKFSKLGGHAISESSHPLIGEPINVIQGRKTPIEGALGLLELPVYPSRKTKEQSSEVTTNLDELRESAKEKLKKGEFPSDEELRAYMNIQEVLDLPTRSGYEEAVKRKAILSKINEIYSDKTLTRAQQMGAISALGVDAQESYLYHVASQDNDIKLAYVMDRLKAQPEEQMKLLLDLRKEIQGERILADGVIKELEEAGIINETQAKFLKNDGQPKARKGRSISQPQPRSIRVPSISTSQVSIPQVSPYQSRQPSSSSYRPQPLSKPSVRRLVETSSNPNPSANLIQLQNQI